MWSVTPETMTFLVKSQSKAFLPLTKHTEDRHWLCNRQVAAHLDGTIRIKWSVSKGIRPANAQEARQPNVVVDR